MDSTNRNQESKRFLNDNDRAQLLFSRRELHTNEEPYYSGFIDRYLPEPIYQQLAQNFPAELTTINYDVRSQLETPEVNRDSLANMPVLKELFTFFTTDQFLLNLREWIAPAMERHRQDFDRREWIYEHKWLSTKRNEKYRSIDVTFKFVTMTTEESLCPHTDESRKILSLVLYFTDPAWKEDYGGGTDVYEPKYQILKNNWHDIYAPVELMNRLHTYQFVGNRLVFVLKSANSWHGVSPIRCPGGMLRKSLLVTFHDNNARRQPKYWGLIRRGITRSLSLIEKQRVNLASVNGHNHSVMVVCTRKVDTK